MPKPGPADSSRHRLHGPPAGNNPSEAACALLREADAILSLNSVDLAGAFKAACGAEPPSAKVISASLDHLVHNGWSMDYQGLPPVDTRLAVEPDSAVAGLLPLLKPRSPGWAGRQPTQPPELPAVAGEKIPPLMLAAALREALGSRPTCLIRSPLAWANNTWDVAHPLDALGGDGGGGIGSGPGMAVGAALGLRDSAWERQGAGRLPVAVLGDGDYLMGARRCGPRCITASRCSSSCRTTIRSSMTNCTRTAWRGSATGRSRTAGSASASPIPNPISACWQGAGARGIGPIRRPDELPRALRAAINASRRGGVAVVDVRVEPGYAPVNSAAISRGAKG